LASALFFQISSAILFEFERQLKELAITIESTGSLIF